MLENHKKYLDNGKEFWALSTGVFKAFDCIVQKRFIAKLLRYGFSPTVLNLIHLYLTNRTQRIKINNSFSKQSVIEYGIRHRSVLGSLLFNINLTDLFNECNASNIINYVDDTTSYR